MTINGLSFTGRETMLTKGVKAVGENVAAKAYEYVGAGKYFPNAKKASNTSVSYKSPFEPVGELKPIESKELTPAQKMEMSYALSHGTPEVNIGRIINLVG